MEEVPQQAKDQGKKVSERLTISVPQAARRLGIGRNQGYECARRGEIPTIRLGKRIVVPLAALEAMLAVQSKQQIAAIELLRRLQRDASE
jgi:excisionase family DNA binding protein